MEGVTKYLGFVLAFFIAVITIIAPEWWVYSELGWALASLFGVANLAVLRKFIESQGWKTYVLLGGQALLSILLAFQVITQELFAELMALLGTLTGATLLQAQRKSADSL